MVAEGMAQRIGALGRQTVLAVFVGSRMAFAVGMGFQTTCGIVAEGLFTAVGIAGEGEVLVGVVVVFGVLSQRIRLYAPTVLRGCRPVWFRNRSSR